MSPARFTRSGNPGIGILLAALALTACSQTPDNAASGTAAANDAAPPPAAAPAGTPAAADTATLDGTRLASFTGDVTKGAQDFMACKICHALDRNMLGPHLHGVVGRKAGSLPDFAYSDAMKRSGITWTPDKLFQFLEGPQHVVPGTRMSFPGDHDPQRRADIIAYLKAN